MSRFIKIAAQLCVLVQVFWLIWLTYIFLTGSLIGFADGLQSYIAWFIGAWFLGIVTGFVIKSRMIVYAELLFLAYVALGLSGLLHLVFILLKSFF